MPTSKAIDSASCPHCGAPVEGTADRFCCSGCETAAAIIAGAGLDTYYDRRDALPARPEALAGDWSAVSPIQRADGLVELRMSVDGLRCTACTWLVEHAIQDLAGVEEATVSYATGRATVAWNPDKTEVGDIAQRVAALGYRPRPVDSAPKWDRDLLTRLGVSAFCMMNVMLLSASLYAGWWSGMELKFQTLFRWASLMLATPVALYGAAPFFEGAWRGLVGRRPGMDLPIALAVGVVFAHGVAATVMGFEGYLDSLTMLVTALLAGRVVETRGRQHAMEAATALASSLPSRARRITDRGVVDVAADALVPGDLIQVGAGEVVPADGVVLEGRAQVRMSMLTGESEPVVVEAGAGIIAGAEVLTGTLKVEVERAGEDVLGQQMARSMAQALDRETPESPTDALAPVFTVATVVLASLGGVFWGLSAGVGEGIAVAVAVLVVACPCALGLAWPVATSAGLAALARRGVLVRSGEVLQRLAEVDCVAMDKTGTLTLGQPRVVEVDDTVLRLAAAVEVASHHPVARAVLDAARERDLPIPSATELNEIPGVGVQGVVDGRRVSVSAGDAGRVVVRADGVEVGEIRLADVPRTKAAQAVRRLAQDDVPLALLSGDHQAVVDRIGAGLGVDDRLGGLKPADKVAWLQARQAEGRHPLFVGDGLNDGPALSAAHVGFAMAEGSTASVLAADGIVQDGRLDGVVQAVAVAALVRKLVRVLLALSLSYNALAVGAALLGYINPLVAAVLMPLSSLAIVASGLSVEPLVQREVAWTSSSS